MPNLGNQIEKCLEKEQLWKKIAQKTVVKIHESYQWRAKLADDVALLKINCITSFILEVITTVKLAETTDHLYNMTSHPRRPTLSLPKPIQIQFLLYKTTACLTQTATTFFVPQMKKNLSKQPLQNIIEWRNGKWWI